MAESRALLLVIILRFAVAGFWFEHSHDKWEWFQTGELQRRLLNWNENAQGAQKLYLEKFCIPHYQALQYLVVFGELAVSVSFLFGYWTRLAALGGAFMALSFLFAQGSLLTWHVIGNPYGLMTILGTLVAAYGGGDSRWSVAAWRGKKEKPKQQAKQ